MGTQASRGLDKERAHGTESRHKGLVIQMARSITQTVTLLATLLALMVAAGAGVRPF